MTLATLKNIEHRIPLFHLAFRPFFLFAAVFSIAALSLWTSVWFSVTSFVGESLSPYGGWFWWHGHEMLFGFVVTVIAGFLLTAVQTWTGLPSVRGYALFAVFSLWLLARILLLFPGKLSIVLIAAVDCGFLVIVALIMGFLVIKARLWRNLLFVPVLLLLATLNAFMHWSAQVNDVFLYKKVAACSIFLLLFIISLMGGRVIPMFTANGTQTQKVLPIRWLDITALLSILLLALATAANAPNLLLAGLALVACISHLLRTLRWKIWQTLHVPLLWSLHGAFWFLVLGFLQLALFYSGIISDYISVLHTLTVGAMGLIILAMISRVSLGHTGRKLNTRPVMSLAFIAIMLAALIRTLGPLLLPSAWTTLSYAISTLAWLIGFGVFVWIYFPILCKARVDSRPG